MTARGPDHPSSRGGNPPHGVARRPGGPAARLVGVRLACGLAVALTGLGLKAAEPEEKKGPEHNVQLEEDEAVGMLLKRAREACAKAAQDPEAWPVCVKAYSEILAKHGDKVYLYRWSGDNQEDAKSWGLGVYRSVAEKVGEELSSLPPAGLAVYRAVNDGIARNLFAEGLAKLDERELGDVSQTYFSTAWGDDALFALAEIAYDRGASRQAAARLLRIQKHPDPSVPRVALLARLFLAQLKSGQRAEAEQTLAQLGAAAQDPRNGALRIADLEGDAALNGLRARLGPPSPSSASKGIAELGLGGPSGDWDTYFGNAAHDRVSPARATVGVRKWSHSIARLLGAPKDYLDRPFVTVREMNTGQVRRVSRLNTNLVTRGSWFFLCNSRLIACHAISNPNPDRPQYWYPSPSSAWPALSANAPPEQNFGVVGNPLFCTLGEDHLYTVLGPEPLQRLPRGWGGGGEQKQPPNWLVAVGKKRGGALGLEGGSLLWTLEPGSDPDCRINSQADQKWLAEVFFTTAPTYADGALYVMAADDAGNSRVAYAVALDAATGKLLWKTKLCTGQPAFFNSGVQPALGLPVAVSGGAVYCVTNLGAAAALEAATGNIRWLRVYDRVPGLEMDPRQGVTPTASDFWEPTPPIVTEDAVLIAPQDAPALYALDPQTGRRKWQLDRARDTGAGGANTERLQTIVGLVNQRLVLTGKSLAIVDLKGGRVEYETSWTENPVVARGVIAKELVFIPTAKGIVSVDMHLGASGKPTAKLRNEQFLYANPKVEAGNLFIAGDVLFSVSATHVNAYFIPEAIEARLKERLAATPGDLAAWAELGDLYHVQDRTDDAVAAFDQGLAQAAAKGADAKVKEQVEDLRARKFEAFFAAGMKVLKTDPAAASKRFEQALATTARPDQPVRALWKLAEAALVSKDAVTAVMHFQRLLTEFGGTSFSFEANTSCLASVYAQRRLELIKKENPQALEQLEARARKTLDEAIAKKDVPALEAALRQFPNSDAYGEGLLALLQLALEKKEPGLARTYGQRFLALKPHSPRLAEGVACLALAYEQTGMLGAARNQLRRLAREPALRDASLSLPGSPPAPAGGSALLTAGAWAAARLAEPLYQKPVTNAARSLGDGKLVETWSKPAPNLSAPLTPAGQPPAGVSKAVFYVEQGDELSARNGLTGEDLWIPRPKAPAGSRGNPSLWSGELLILAGAQEVLAYDTRQNGKVAWTYGYNAAAAPAAEGELQQVEVDLGNPYAQGRRGLVSLAAADQLVILGLPNGQLAVLEANSGQTLWTAKGEGAPLQGAPAAGDGFVAVGSTKRPPVIGVYDLGTGQRRFELKPPGNQLQAPAAVGDRIYLICADQRVRAYSASDGRQVWEFSFSTQPVALEATAEMVICVLANQEVVALDPNAGSTSLTAGAQEEKRLLWKALPEQAGQFAGVVQDGEDVFVATRLDGRRGQLAAYQSRGGKLKWRVETSGEAIDADRCLAREHLLIGQGAFDPRGRVSSAAALVSRASGKLTWVQNAVGARPATALLFDGGVAVNDGNKLTGFLTAGSTAAAQDLEALKQDLAKTPGDAKLRLRLAQILFDRGEGAQALEALLPALSDDKLEAEAFSAAYEKLARFRNTLSRTLKPTLLFSRVREAPQVDGTLATWKKIPSVTLSAWRDLYLADSDEGGLPFAHDAWKGPADLSVTFYGAYDDQNLYAAFAVTDDLHSNPQTEAVELWKGDSVQLAFDLERDTRMGFFGNDFELGLALNDQGQPLACRWVEKGKYVMKPLEAQAKAVRNEGAKQTVYTLAVPLEYLGLKPAAGLKFGFTFMVNDADQGGEVRKGLAPSPGIWNPKSPGQYATGQLGE